VLFALAVVAVAVVALPWNADVAPWAPLELPTISAFTAEQIATIESYVNAVWLPSLLSIIAGPVAAVTVLLVPSLRQRLCSFGPARRPVLRDLLVGALLLVIVRVAALPWLLWTASVRREAGLLLTSWPEELLRWLAETAVYVVLGSTGIALALSVLRRAPRRGWIALVVLGVVAAALISAVVPLIQRLEGTQADARLAARVQAVAQDLGVDVGDVVIIETGDRSPVLNANVSGWGPTRAVTLYDTLAAGATEAEIDALVAHELIHVRENDVVIGSVLAVLGTGAVVAFAAALVLSPGVRRRLGARSSGDAPVIPLLVAVVLVGALAGTVLASTASRQIEARADHEAVAATGDPAAYDDLMVRLATTNRSTLTPPQWRYALFFTHPTPLQRLAATSSSD